MKRKAVSISIADAQSQRPILVALADDGTLWRMDLGEKHLPEDNAWVRLEDLPSPTPEDQKALAKRADILS